MEVLVMEKTPDGVKMYSEYVPVDLYEIARATANLYCDCRYMTHIKVDSKIREYDWNGNACTHYMNTDIPVMSLKIPTDKKEADMYYKRIRLEVDNMKPGTVLTVPYLREPYSYDLFEDVEFVLEGYAEPIPGKKVIECPDDPEQFGPYDRYNDD
jgi:hypothetical protein